ncbi:MAG: hypothetical protein WAN66_18605 [Limnoraphis robusta]|jgi:hypothetical protein|uniref:SPOR domain-containing protein n=2 Tax=Limnoraphis robusta TaxID=1118279 RepID=A0A0F5YK71_9CYAN|nr:hypothetical protein [Limnoraphis robusta]MCG5060247.1 hypothetical protein [Limnoraphis sp. WC205]KKD39042.1 hypothetical protein WN50_05585 [Limnoraphis robusta CS-951]MEA5501074.1 hypothetical protein [Limnoraphis robusta BA-68 BA1]MEA5519751.1 hypothetical protein [Limnoraphis robusta CCNP1315]MEA5538887.1 hypothetical protein [Limnoraphis robusta Tam1]
MPENNSTSKSSAVSYRDRLNPWTITRLLPNLERTVIGRFRSRSNAEGHLQHLKQVLPKASFTLAFDSQSEEIQD